MVKNKIGERIAALRAAFDESQQDLADALDVKRETVKFWESGDRHIKEDDIVRLAKYFGVSSDVLLGIQDTQNCGTAAHELVLLNGLVSEFNTAARLTRSVLDQVLSDRRERLRRELNK